MKDEIDNYEAQGKIASGLRGLGTASLEDVQRRAEELAIMDGLAADQADERHFARARAELAGEDLSPDDVVEQVDAVTEWDEVEGESGSKAPNIGTGDEQSVAERLVHEGVAEAEHEQMLAATQKLRREEDDLEPTG